MLNTPRPTFSAVIPTKQDGTLFQRALESVGAQTLLPDEIIVVDHGSTDGTLEYVARFRERLAARGLAPSVRLVQYPGWLPVAHNWNRAVSHVTSQYFHILHSDDELEPVFYERCLAAFQADPQLDYLSTSILPIDADGRAIRRARSRLKDPLMALARATGLIRGRGFLLLFGLFGTMLYCPAVMYRKSFFDRIGGFNPDYMYCIDYEMWVRSIRSGGKYAYLSDRIYRYRISDASTAERHRFQTDYYLEEFRAYHLPWSGNRLLALLSVPALTALLLEDLAPLDKVAARRFAKEVVDKMGSRIWAAWLGAVSRAFVSIKR